MVKRNAGYVIPITIYMVLKVPSNASGTFSVFDHLIYCVFKNLFYTKAMLQNSDYTAMVHDLESRE